MIADRNNTILPNSGHLNDEFSKKADVNVEPSERRGVLARYVITDDFQQ